MGTVLCGYDYKTDCLVCTPSTLKELVVLPNPHSYQECVDFNHNFCHPECLSYLGSPEYQKYYSRTGCGDWCKQLDMRINHRKMETQ